MTVKSSFKLDKRIKSINDIQSIICNDLGFIGCKGFVFDNFVQTKDLTKCKYVTLVDIDDNDGGNDQCFKVRDKNGNNFVGYYRFFIPEKLLKPIEKKYRPYTMNEFKAEFKIGMVLTLRKREESDYIYQVVYQGNRQYDDSDSDENLIYLSRGTFFLKELFDIFEIVRNGDWQPFGVEVKE